MWQTKLFKKQTLHFYHTPKHDQRRKSYLNGFKEQPIQNACFVKVFGVSQIIRENPEIINKTDSQSRNSMPELKQPRKNNSMKLKVIKMLWRFLNELWTNEKKLSAAGMWRWKTSNAILLFRAGEINHTFHLKDLHLRNEGVYVPLLRWNQSNVWRMVASVAYDVQ